jgi:site-specific DNA recombinase
MMTKRAVLYARVSSDDRGKDGRNLIGQLDICREYVGSRGYPVVAELAEDDRGASGASFELPQLGRILQMAEAREFEVLAVRELDRLSRNLAKQLIVEEELNRHGVEVEYALADYPDTPEGRLNKHIRATIAEYEREKIAERTARGTRNKVKAGSVMVYGHTPYGYQVIDGNGKWKLVVYEPEARIVRLMFDWYANGDENGNILSLADITRRLDKMGVLTRGDKEELSKKRGIGKWSRPTIRNMLVNETYAGVWHYGKRTRGKDKRRRKVAKKEWIAVEVPAIVPRETWEIVQTRLRENRYRANRRRKHKYLLGAHVTCGSCGLKMLGAANGRFDEPKTIAYYVCRARSAKLDLARECNAPCFRANDVDEAVWDWIKSFLTDPEVLAQGLRDVQQKREQENAPIRSRLAVVDDLLVDNRTQLERLLDLYLAGDFPKEMLTDRKARMEKTIQALEKEQIGLLAHLEGHLLSVEQIKTIQEFAAGVSQKLDAMDNDLDAKRRLIEMLDVQVTLTTENGEKVIYARCILGQDSWPVSSTTRGDFGQLLVCHRPA